ncbi:MAG: Na+/H+ antiporter NhaC family protein [Gemmatimonadetes bacterium]|nr:Na+/H+ antiporter NhaC family protein [Gemmatimonadota bacterium]MYE92774.1 Na+/H+ antiporter NhaC family protein [Gemmatimonadota bacterium]MYJ09336.1 Na+/H+ antiporter NhaC family protein [Gemmatimonadota bacterium]
MPSVGRGWRRPLAGLVRALAVAPGLALLLLGTPAGARAQEAVEAPRVILGSVPFTIAVHGAEELSSLVEVRNAEGTLIASGTVGAREVREFRNVVVGARGELPLDVRVGDTTHAVDSTFAPGWFSILPPLLAIALALIFKEVITALLAGVWLGALAVAGYNPVQATWRLVDQYVVPALGDTDGGHTQIVVFSLMLGGMVGIVSRNGGTRGVVRAVAPLARNRRRGKVATAIAGLAIFFDDYANTLVVGNTMRPITDRLKVSREKLAYLVDSTAAPIAALVPVSTWVGYEVSLIGGGLTSAAATTTGADAALLANLSPYTVFIQTIPYLFYPILAFSFVLLTSFMNRDFGSMARAEARAAAGRGLYREGAMLATDTSKSFVDAKEGSPRRWWNAGIPVLTVVAVVLGGLYVSGRAAVGEGASLMDTFGAADPFNTLLWGSLAGCLVAAVLTLGQRILTVHECIDAWAGGVKAMITAMVILTLAWSLGAVTQDVGTAGYLSQLLGGNLPLFLLPALVFVTSGAMAFATGTSWTTMAILIPLVIPLTVSLAGGTGFADGTMYGILLGTTSSVLAGAIWGDHCSPISDTTVLSSTAAACDHVDHVRTQLPYALLVGAVGLTLGSVGTALGLPTWIALPLGVAVLAIFLRVFGTPVPEIEGSAATEDVA